MATRRSRRVSASMADLRKIYRAGAAGKKVSLATMVPGTKQRNPKKKTVKRSVKRNVKRATKKTRSARPRGRR